MRKKIVAGNWKMNGLKQDLAELDLIANALKADSAEIIICPPATLLAEAVTHAKLANRIKIGAQDAHEKESGAYTGNISMDMLKDLGVTHCILGHSERREYHGETNALIASKAVAAHKAGIVAIICVGEKLEERESNRAESIVKEQLLGSIPPTSNAQNTIIAYEPVWAIGTGKTPTLEDIKNMHAFIRSHIPDSQSMRVLYGGSVKPSNAQEIFALGDVDGGLVGGASLKSQDFLPIIKAAL